MNNPFHVLLVDDDDVYLSLVRVVLKKLDLEVELARLQDGDELPSHIESSLRGEAPWPQLILLDQRMPHVDGTEALSALKEHPVARAIPVCMMSSSDQESFISEAYRRGAAFCITKPIEFAHLKRKLSTILEFWSDIAQPPPAYPPVESA